MSYVQMAQLDVLNVVNGIKTQEDYIKFHDVVAHYFAEKAQKAIDAMWNDGAINQSSIEHWGNEHMRTSYRHAAHRS